MKRSARLPIQGEASQISAIASRRAYAEVGTIAGCPILVVFGAKGLSGITFDPSEVAGLEAAEAPAIIAEPLARYLGGEPEAFVDVPLDLVGTVFQRRVWAELRAIPHGQVRSYGEIARRIGVPRGMRAVGAANGENPIPIVVPCHRVVEASFGLGGFSGGLHVKRALLELEGARIDAGRVRVKQLGLFD